MNQTNRRIVELDGLRGVAAMWVVFYHLWGAIQKRDVTWVPDSVGVFFHAGFLGVDIFFVLSGFVITYSLSNIRITPTFVPRFMLRRSVRIDPPYWGAILLAILLILLKNRFFPAHSAEIPDPTTVVAHLFYLQDLLEFGNISSVFWTLCLEFQFYILFSAFYYMYSNLEERRREVALRYFTFFAIVFCAVSPLIRFSSLRMPIPGTIIPFAYEFILGILVYHYTKGNVRLRFLLLAVVVSSMVTLIFKPIHYALIPAVTTLIIAFSGRTEAFSILKSRVMRFLGKISYSLYLTHAIVGWVSISLFSYFLESYSGVGVTVGIFIIGIVISMMFSLLYYFLLEKPSLKFSKFLKRRT